MKQRVDITLPMGLKERAKELGINISFQAARAIENEVKRVESYRSKK